MSAISTTMHLRPQFHHSTTRSGKTLSLRLVRLIADLTNDINQQPPSVGALAAEGLALAIFSQQQGHVSTLVQQSSW